MRAILSIPLFFYILVAANLIMWTGSADSSTLNLILLEFSLPSQRTIIFTVSDALILASILALYVETFKATRTSVSAIIDHALSLLVFVACLIEFMIFPLLGNTTFFFITVASMMDVVMGFTVTISAAKRDINFEG